MKTNNQLNLLKYLDAPVFIKGTQMHELFGPHMSNYQIWLRKIKEAFDPDNIADSRFYISPSNIYFFNFINSNSITYFLFCKLIRKNKKLIDILIIIDHKLKRDEFQDFIVKDFERQTREIFNEPNFNFRNIPRYNWRDLKSINRNRQTFGDINRFA